MHPLLGIARLSRLLNRTLKNTFPGNGREAVTNDGSSLPHSSEQETELNRWLELAATGQQATKHFFRKHLVQELRQSQYADEEAFLDVWFSTDSRQILGELTARLRK